MSDCHTATAWHERKQSGRAGGVGRTESAGRDEACRGDCNIGGAHNP